MRDWIASGRVLDPILIAVLLEAAALSALFAYQKRGIPPPGLLPNLAAGFCLLLTMRVALAGAWWGFISLGLLGALVAHVIDLRGRWAGKRF